METAIRFSRNSPAGNDDQRFLRIDASSKSILLCQITEIVHRVVKYDVIHASAKVPAFRTFDWHPVNESLIAVGQSGGDATLLNIAEGYQDSVSFTVRSQRLCNAVALSAQNLIAAGLDKVRNDFCLNIWDLNQSLPTASSRSSSKSHTESPQPLHKLAGGEPISSLKFFSDEPRLLAAGVKGQFVRLYDLREPNSSNGLQFATRCVNNIAIDPADDNYLASCYPTSEPMVCVWDRRMVTRLNASPVSFTGSAQSESRQPEASLEMKSAVDSPGAIWSLRFSKSRRSCLGVLSSIGQLRAFDFGSDYASEKLGQGLGPDKQVWFEAEPQDVFLDDARDIERPFPQDRSPKEQKKRVVSFDFTTSNNKYGEAKALVLTGEGEVRMTELRPAPEPASISSTGFFCKGSSFIAAPSLDLDSETLPKSIDKIRRSAEPRNALKLAFKQARQSKSTSTHQQMDTRRMSNFANQSWNADLGFSEKGVALEDLLRLISVARLRCEAGYLLNANKNRAIIGDSQWLDSYWSWIERAERISRNGNMMQDNVDLSYIGVFGIWMEEIAIKQRLVGSSTVSKSGIIKNLTNRLNIPVRRLCSTEYRAHRLLCLHISGLAWGQEELEVNIKKLISGNQHTKAGAIALFANDEKLAYQALRSKSSAQTHKMLAMALAGSKQRRKTSNPSSANEDSSTEGDDDWSETISSLSADLTDPYARAILAYVKSGDWSDVLDIEALPLKHRIGVALRHLDDNELTAYIGRITRQVIESGDIEGILLTGIGTTEGLGLLVSYARIFNDLQTAILGLSFGGVAERFIVNNNERDTKARRSIEAFRETYRSHIMRWGLKFDRVRFDVTSSKALAQSPQHKSPRPKEQIRLVCTFCSGSLTQFPTNSAGGSVASTPGISQGPGGMRITDTSKHPLTGEKAAVTGTVCPKCGRHLPRCGVCDLWLGAPDETYAKWYTTQQQSPSNGKATISTSNGTSTRDKNTGMDLTVSMTGSSMITVGPPASTSTSTTIKADSTDDNVDDKGEDGEATDRRLAEDESEIAKQAEEKWHTAMQKFTVFCVSCGHGFHAGHARLWFEGRDGRVGHRVCPVPECECRCNG